MLYFFQNDDFSLARKSAETFWDEFLTKNPDVAVFEMNDETWSAERFEEYLSGQTLFGSTHAVFLRNTFSDDTAREYIAGATKRVAQSPHTFVFAEGKIDAKTRTLFEKEAEHAPVLGEKQAPTREFNIFPLADALGMRDRKNAWLMLERALREGVSGENIYGILFWQIKALLLVKNAGPGEKTGLKPFAEQKARRLARNFTLQELRELSATLISLYHDSRKGLHELDAALLRFVLTL